MITIASFSLCMPNIYNICIFMQLNLIKPEKELHVGFKKKGFSCLCHEQILQTPVGAGTNYAVNRIKQR